jgi:spore coat polysaccharide biosynthesis protein SpsF (cytidylyltransferase family)
MEGRIEHMSDYEFFEALKREHEKYETGKRARNISQLLEKTNEIENEDELVRALQNLFL